jgi:predicted Fe-Mo cluster-binding NifX family protein
MKIAISSSGTTLDSALDPRFGRCACFLIVDPADMSHEAFDNQSTAQSSGAGIQAAQFLADKNVNALITGHVGPNAVQTLAAAGITVFAEQRGTVREVVERYKSGSLKPATQATVAGRFGTGAGARSARPIGPAQAAGFGRAVGPRGSRGMVRGGGRRIDQGAGRGRGRGGGIRRTQ